MPPSVPIYGTEREQEDPAVLVQVDSIVLDEHVTSLNAPIVVSDAGVLVVYDPTVCRFYRFQLPAGDPLTPIGRCGEPPLGFRRVSGAAFVGDTLIVFDPTLNAFNAVDSAGTVVKIGTPPSLMMTRIMNSMGSWRDGMILAELDPPQASADPRAITFRVRDVPHGRAFMLDVSGSRASAESESMGMRLCAGSWNGTNRAVVSQSWRYETVVSDREGNPLWAVYEDLPWMGSYQAPGREKGAVWPAALVRPPICGEFGFLVRYANADPATSRGGAYRNGGRIELWGPSGERRFTQDVDGGMPFLFAPGIAWNNLVIFEDIYAKKVMLRVFELRRTNVRSPVGTPAVFHSDGAAADAGFKDVVVLDP